MTRSSQPETLDLFAEAPAEVSDALSVSDLNRQARSVLEAGLGRLRVVGEVTNWTRARSGHRYFTLRDEHAQVRCVLWRDAARRLPIDPEDGMQVLVDARVTLYEAGGSYQLTVLELDTVGDEGLHQRAFDELRRRLQAEGLLDAARKRPVPRMPVCVGVVTSTSGAALRDILTVLRRRAPWTRVVVANARVQGEGASDEVAAAIVRLASSGLPESIIVGRGGGSKEDLWEFNREPVARAIAACPVPVISAVGHETDVTIADLVADHRAPTPSAAAEAAVPDRAIVAEWVGEASVRARAALRRRVQRQRERIERGRPRLRQALRMRVTPRAERVRHLEDALRRGLRRLVERRRSASSMAPALARAMGSAVQRQRAELSRLAGHLDALSPLATLHRGYALPRDAQGRVLRRVDDFDRGENFRLRVSDGEIACRVADDGPVPSRDASPEPDPDDGR